MPKIKKKSNCQTKDKNSYILKMIFIGASAGIICFFIFTTLLTLLAFIRDFNENYYPYLVLFPSSIGAFASGFVSVAPVKRNGLIIGSMSVLPMFFFIAAVASIVSRTGIELWGWIYFGVMIISGGFGGILAANKRKRVKLK